MTEETTDNIQEEVMVMKIQIAALTGLITHLLCLSTMHVALDTGDTNFERVARDVEDLAFETASVIEDDAPAVVAEARRLQKEIFKTVRLQFKKAARIMKVTAMNKSICTR